MGVAAIFFSVSPFAGGRTSTFFGVSYGILAGPLSGVPATRICSSGLPIGVVCANGLLVKHSQDLVQLYGTLGRIGGRGVSIALSICAGAILPSSILGRLRDRCYHVRGPVPRSRTLGGRTRTSVLLFLRSVSNGSTGITHLSFSAGVASCLSAKGYVFTVKGDSASPVRCFVRGSTTIMYSDRRDVLRGLARLMASARLVGECSYGTDGTKGGGRSPRGVQTLLSSIVRATCGKYG